MGRESDGEAFARVSVCPCVCVCMCARACACAHVFVTYTHSLSFSRALEQLLHSVALLLSLSAAASSVLGIWCLWAPWAPWSSVKPRGPTELPTGERRQGRRRALLRPAADDARSSSPLQKTRQSSNGQIQLDTPTTSTSSSFFIGKRSFSFTPCGLGFLWKPH